MHRCSTRTASATLLHFCFTILDGPRRYKARRRGGRRGGGQDGRQGRARDGGRYMAGRGGARRGRRRWLERDRTGTSGEGGDWRRPIRARRTRPLDGCWGDAPVRCQAPPPPTRGRPRRRWALADWDHSPRIRVRHGRLQAGGRPRAALVPSPPALRSPPAPSSQAPPARVPSLPRPCQSSSPIAADTLSRCARRIAGVRPSSEAQDAACTPETQSREQTWP